MFCFDPHDYPVCSGVYLMKDRQSRLLYVGKANNLRQRLSSYFRSGSGLPPKTQTLVKQINDIDILCTTTEKEALLLEASLIKKHKPRYNIVLRDDKAYVLFKLDTSSDYPRLTLTRKVKKDGSVYFGPFTSALAARETLKVINRIFPLRKCRDSTFANRTRPCLQYDMKRCLGPCVFTISAHRYQSMVKQLKTFLSGRSRDVLAELSAEMHTSAETLDFEKAAQIRDQIRAIERTVERQTVIWPDGGDCDVLGAVVTEDGLSIALMFIRQGKLLDSKHFHWETRDHHPWSMHQGAESADKGPDSEVQNHGPQGLEPGHAGEGLWDDSVEAEQVQSFLVQFYTADKLIPDRIVLPFEPEHSSLQEILCERKGGFVSVVQASGAREKQLLDMARTNAREIKKSDSFAQVLDGLQSRLGLSHYPERIEAVDASHLGGQAMVVGQVVFESGLPLPSAYRIYSFPELEGTRDDYAALRHWCQRRIRSGPPWPDLVLIDGGRGQLEAVVRTLSEMSAQGFGSDSGRDASTDEEQTGSQFEAVFECASLSKATRRKGELVETVFRPDRMNPVPLKPGSRELLFLQHLRDTAHRFVLSRQRRSRKRDVTSSQLLEIPGVGPQTARVLFDRFGSIEAIFTASAAELASVSGIGRKKAESIVSALKNRGLQDSV